MAITSPYRNNDQQGLAVTGSASAVTCIDLALADYYGWTGDPVAQLENAAVADPSCSLSYATLATLYMLNGVRGDDARVTTAIDNAKSSIGGTSPREQKHLMAAEAWAQGGIVRATDIWEYILIDHPCDAWALRFAHDSYFYLGHSQSIRDSIARVLPSWDNQNVNYGFVLGQYAFGLEEMGDYKRAYSVGQQALEINQLDAWAVHAVAHVMEMQSRQAEGIEFLKGMQPYWRKAEALSVHNGWHLALYLLEKERVDEVLQDYDRFVKPRIADDSLLDLVDASSLLWRLELIGGDAGNRWELLAAQWMTHVDEHVLVFNDIHLAMAAVRAGGNNINVLLNSLDDYAVHGRGDNHQITSDVGRCLVDAIVAFAGHDYRRTIELLLPVRYKIIRIGGSHAQRDVFAQTLMESARRAGEHNLYRNLVAERLAWRPTKKMRALSMAI